MSERIFTLFGEEIVPEQLKAVGKSRAKKKAEEKAEPEKILEVTTSDQPQPEVTADAVQAAEVTVAEEVATAEQPKVAPAEKKFVIPEDWQGDKKYYSIGEVADLFKVKTSHIRFWTNEFKLKVRTTRKGDRLFTPEQVKELRTIHHLVKERGFTLTGAKAKLKTENSIDVETIDLKRSLLQLRNKLVAIRNKIPSAPKGEV